jgi:hypothetical protein
MGSELRRMEARLGIVRPQRTEIMLNLEGLTRSSIEARIEYLTQKRVTENGESRQFAELQVTRTGEGRELWEKVRKLRLAEDADSAPVSAFSHTAASVIGFEARLDNLISQRMNDCGETRANAERAVIHTSDGLDLWQKVRTLKLAESRDED